MSRRRCLYFGPFRLETDELHLWHGERPVALRRQSLLVLLCLASRPAQVIAKEELLQELWNGASVSRSVLRVCIREIREALDEQVHAPQYIETMGYEGYRFCAAVTGTQQTLAYHTPPKACMFGRQDEVSNLKYAFKEAARGSRQLALINGEIGIGKTALAEAFWASYEAEGQAQVIRGQCIESHAAEIPYLPVFDALEQLCQARYGDMIRHILPGLGERAEQTQVGNRIDSMAQTRLFLELARAL